MTLAVVSASQPENGELMRTTRGSEAFVRPTCAGLRLYGGLMYTLAESTGMTRSRVKKVPYTIVLNGQQDMLSAGEAS